MVRMVGHMGPKRPIGPSSQGLGQCYSRLPVSLLAACLQFQDIMFIRSQKGFFAKRVFGIRCFGANFQIQAESQPP
jgi:hypothetical protein